MAAAKAVWRSSCGGGDRREPAWILGFRRKRTNLHEKYGYPGMGFAAKSLSGLSVSDEAIKAAFCGADESLACWIVAGRPRQPAQPRQSEPVVPALETWRPTQP